MKAKKWALYVFGLFLVLNWSCVAQESGITSKAPTAASLLWKISGKDLAQPSYLFGTIHMICPEDFFWTPQMQTALDSTDQVAFELNMDDPALFMKVTRGMMLPEGKSLDDYFDPDDYKKIAKFVTDSLMVPKITLQRLRPFAVLRRYITQALSC